MVQGFFTPSKFKSGSRYKPSLEVMRQKSFGCLNLQTMHLLYLRFEQERQVPAKEWFPEEVSDSRNDSLLKMHPFLCLPKLTHLLKRSVFSFFCLKRA